MNAQLNPTPSQLVGLEPGTKQAIVYDYLATRTESTHSQIKSALAHNRQFTRETEPKKVAKEVSNALRHLIDKELVSVEKSDQVYYSLSVTVKTPRQDNPEPTPPLTTTPPEVNPITPDNYHETLAEVAQELIQEAVTEQEQVVWKNQTTAEELTEFNYHLEPKELNSQATLTSSPTFEEIMEKKLDNLTFECARLKVVCKEITENQFITPDGAEFYEPQAAVNHAKTVLRESAFKLFLEENSRKLGINGPVVIDLLLEWENKRQKYLPLLVR